MIPGVSVAAPPPSERPAAARWGPYSAGAGLPHTSTSPTPSASMAGGGGTGDSPLLSGGGSLVYAAKA